MHIQTKERLGLIVAALTAVLCGWAITIMAGCGQLETDDCQPGFVKDANQRCVVDPATSVDSEGNILDPACQSEPDQILARDVWFNDGCFDKPITDPVLDIGPSNKQMVRKTPGLGEVPVFNLRLRSCVIYSYCLGWTQYNGLHAEVCGESPTETFPISGFIEVFPPGNVCR